MRPLTEHAAALTAAATDVSLSLQRFGLAGISPSELLLDWMDDHGTVRHSAAVRAVELHAAACKAIVAFRDSLTNLQGVLDDASTAEQVEARA